MFFYHSQRHLIFTSRQIKTNQGAKERYFNKKETDVALKNNG